MGEITNREREVLRELEAFPRCMRMEWARPMDCGGYDGSHHGKTLARLAEKGLAEVKSWGGIRKVNKYRITDAGREALGLETAAARKQEGE